MEESRKRIAGGVLYLVFLFPSIGRLWCGINQKDNYMKHNALGSPEIFGIPVDC